MKTNRYSKIHIIKQILIIWLSVAKIGYAQNLEINPAFGTIKEKSVKGFVVCLELDVKSVEGRWQTYLKSLGKFESPEKMAMLGPGIIITSVSNDAIDFYSKITVSPRCLQIFMGATRAGMNVELEESQNDNIKRLLHSFAVEQYRQDLIAQLTEAERVVNLAVKAHDKRTQEGQSLKNKLNKNRNEKIRLLRNLDENERNLQKLRADSTQNVQDMEATMEEIKKVRQIAEEKKSKLGQLK